MLLIDSRLDTTFLFLKNLEGFGSGTHQHHCSQMKQVFGNSADSNIFMHKSAMQHHAREIHRGELKPHQCQQCLKSFSSNHQLTQHIRIHTGEKPYKCSYCDRRFKQLSHVQQHTRLHTGERPYKCHLPECGRAFIQLSNLQQHLRNHDSQMERAKNRPYHCNICGKGFATESSLRTHRSKNSPTGTPSCFLAVDSQHFMQHAALIGGANSQSCPICHKICVNGEALMEHMRAAHKDPNASGAPSKKKRGKYSRSSRAQLTSTATTTTTTTSASTATTNITIVSSQLSSPSSPTNSSTSISVSSANPCSPCSSCSPVTSTPATTMSSLVNNIQPTYTRVLSAATSVASMSGAIANGSSHSALLSTMNLGVGHFMMPSVVGGAGPHALTSHAGGPGQGHPYPPHPLAARPQPSFMNL